jgi:hypothetical protein
MDDLHDILMNKTMLNSSYIVQEQTWSFKSSESKISKLMQAYAPRHVTLEVRVAYFVWHVQQMKSNSLSNWVNNCMLASSNGK